MAVNYSATAKNDRLTAVLTLIDAGAGTPKLVIRDSGNTTLVTIPMDSTTAGSVSAGVLTFDCTPALSATASATGTAHNAIITDVAGTTVVSGLTVGISATNVILDSTSITSGQTVTITSGSITHAADT